MGALSRNKGEAGERVAALLAELTDCDVRRRVRQHDGDSDLEGLLGWCIEVKRHAKASRAAVAGWWRQVLDQADAAGGIPVLFWRQDHDECAPCGRCRPVRLIGLPCGRPTNGRSRARPRPGRWFIAS